MNFFQSQETARRKTSLLVLYYLLAVVFIIAGVYLAIAATFIGLAASAESPSGAVPAAWNLELFLGVVVSIVIVVGAGTLFKVSQLRGGGSVVAQSLGGREVNASTTNRDERKLLNIVEEISIASGVPMPRVYIMDAEPGINAFAAGYSADDAVVSVTRGCLEQFTRDELQGVVAHEFSHILNGDMRLNIRLMGVLHGILIIGILGYMIMRLTMFSSRGRSSSDKKGGEIPIAVMGLIIMAIGYVGVFFGKLIKAAVSRQREFLADASAVQFTRNPAGISDALKKIGGFSEGSRVASPHAVEASHFFFANGMRKSFLGMLATHPPLQERIQRIDPSFQQDAAAAQAPHAGAQKAAMPEGTAGFAQPAAAQAPIAVSAEEAVASVGMPTSQHVVYAREVLAALPNGLVDAAHEGFGARAVIYALLLDSRDEIRDAQLARLKISADAQVITEMERILPMMQGLREEYRIPVIDIAIPALRGLSRAQFEQFKSNIDALVGADMQVDLFEYTLQRIIVHHLTPSFDPKPPPALTHKSMASALPSATHLLSCLAGWGETTPEGAQRAFQSGWRELQVPQDAELIAPEQCGLHELDDALNDLEHAAPPVKQRLVAACTACIASDGKVTTEEAELIRAICDALHCPMPPFLRKNA